MNRDKIIVRIFGVPIAACKPGKTWRDAANFTKNWLVSRFGSKVEVEYIDFLPPKWKEFPNIIDLIKKGKAKIPIVMVGDEIVSSGGKINVSQIENYLLNMGVKKSG